MCVGVRVIVWTNCTMEKKDLNNTPKPVIFEGDKTHNQACCKRCVRANIFALTNSLLYLRNHILLDDQSCIKKNLYNNTFSYSSNYDFCETRNCEEWTIFRDGEAYSSHNWYNDLHLRASRLINMSLFSLDDVTETAHKMVARTSRLSWRLNDSCSLRCWKG